MSWFSCNRVISSLAIVALASFVTPAMASADDVVETGKTVYSQTCIACHGANGKGAIPGVSDFTKADGPLIKSDEVFYQVVDQLQSVILIQFAPTYPAANPK